MSDKKSKTACAIASDIPDGASRFINIGLIGDRTRETIGHFEIDFASLVLPRWMKTAIFLISIPEKSVLAVWFYGKCGIRFSPVISQNFDPRHRE